MPEPVTYLQMLNTCRRLNCNPESIITREWWHRINAPIECEKKTVAHWLYNYFDHDSIIELNKSLQEE